MYVIVHMFDFFQVTEDMVDTLSASGVRTLYLVLFSTKKKLVRPQSGFLSRDFRVAVIDLSRNLFLREEKLICSQTLQDVTTRSV